MIVQDSWELDILKIVIMIKRIAEIILAALISLVLDGSVVTFLEVDFFLCKWKVGRSNTGRVSSICTFHTSVAAVKFQVGLCEVEFGLLIGWMAGDVGPDIRSRSGSVAQAVANVASQQGRLRRTGRAQQYAGLAERLLLLKR